MWGLESSGSDEPENIRKKKKGRREGGRRREASRQAEAVHLGPEATVKTGFD